MPAVGAVKVSTGGDTKVVPGLYQLKLKSCEDVGISTQYPDSSPQWLWKWEVVKSLEAEPDEAQVASKGEVIFDYTADWIGFKSNGERSKALARLDALAQTNTPKPEGEDGEVDPPVDDTEELIGRSIKAAVDVQPNKKGDLRAKLMTVGAMPRRRQQAAPPPPQEDDYADEEPPF